MNYHFFQNLPNNLHFKEQVQGLCFGEQVPVTCTSLTSSISPFFSLFLTHILENEILGKK